MTRKLECRHCGALNSAGTPCRCLKDKIVSIESKMAHLHIDALGGTQHVIPVSFFEGVRTGSRSLKDLEGFDSVVPTIINEWLLSKGI